MRRQMRGMQPRAPLHSHLAQVACATDWQQRLSSTWVAGVWAHEVKQLERGCLLIETGELLPDVKLEVRSKNLFKWGMGPEVFCQLLSTLNPVNSKHCQHSLLSTPSTVNSCQHSLLSTPVYSCQLQAPLKLLRAFL